MAQLASHAHRPTWTQQLEGRVHSHPSAWEEHALYSDADVTGEVEFGPYALLMTLAGNGRVGRASQTLVFRHRDHLIEEPPGRMRDELDLGGWTGGDIGDQAAAVLSLALARRVHSGGVVRQGFEPGDPLGRPFAPTHRTPVLAEPARVSMLASIAEAVMVQEAAPRLERYGKLTGPDAIALTRAAGQYADALWWADADPRISWIKLAGALEVAANRWDRAQDADDPVELLKRHRGALYGKLKKIDVRAIDVVAQSLASMLSAPTPQPADRGRRQPGGVLAQQALQRGAEVPRREALRYRIGITSPTFGDRRAYAGRIREEYRCRSPLSSSTRLSFTLGARSAIVPDPTVTRRSRARPLRTTCHARPRRARH